MRPPEHRVEPGKKGGLKMGLRHSHLRSQSEGSDKQKRRKRPGQQVGELSRKPGVRAGSGAARPAVLGPDVDRELTMDPAM